MASDSSYQVGKFTQLVSILLLVASVYFGIQTMTFKAKSVKVQAEVKELVEVTSQDGKTKTLAPVVAFKTKDGEMIQEQADYSSKPPIAEVGETIDIYYLLENPKTFRIDKLYPMWGFSVMTASLGFMAFFVSRILGMIQKSA